MGWRGIRSTDFSPRQRSGWQGVPKNSKRFARLDLKRRERRAPLTKDSPTRFGIKNHINCSTGWLLIELNRLSRDLQGD
jgi:hypothetical protein